MQRSKPSTSDLRGVPPIEDGPSPGYLLELHDQLDSMPSLPWATASVAAALLAIATFGAGISLAALIAGEPIVAFLPWTLLASGAALVGTLLWQSPRRWLARRRKLLARIANFQERARLIAADRPNLGHDHAKKGNSDAR